jgi:eukaryotic-like serine/threonine-protein kinase
MAKEVKETKYQSFSYMTLFASILAVFSLVSYSKNRDPAILVYSFLIILVCLGLPLIIDFLKSAAVTGIEKEASRNKKDDKAMERIENLEALMCRLDAEINSQLEQTLSAGKIRTLQNVGDSQLPTIFLNISSALENRFQLLKEIGRGGMGIVFQAHDKQLKEQVAIKVLSPLLSNNTDGIERLKREVSAARKITHPNVIRIHDISESGGLHFVSMEYFSGTTLKEIIKRDGSYSAAQGSQIVFQICDGLESAHRHGVIHRDLKSQNIIVNEHGELKIIDFGLATSIHQQGMTATGLILGTPEYMAPEQVSGKKADERADIYSFGIILYEIFTGRVPFTGDTAIAIGFQQMREDPRPPREINPQISSELERIILKALKKEPASRYSSVAEMRTDLESAFQKSVASPVQPARAARSRSEVEIE